MTETEKPCPKCPECGWDMIKDQNGVCKCTNPACDAAVIPKGCKGVFIPASLIGIH